MSTFLITGASGFVGLKLIKRLISEHFVLATYHKNKPTLCSSKLKWIQYDTYHPSELLNEINSYHIDCCVHLSWVGNTGDLRANETIQIENISNTLKLIDVLKTMNVPRFIGAGTLAEKDVLNYHLHDGSCPGKNSCYGVSKLSTHFFSKIKCNSLGIEHIWCTFANVFGPGDTTNNIVNHTIEVFEQKKEANFTEGLQMYDLIYIDDLVEGVIKAALHGRPNYNYYIGSGAPEPLRKYISTIRDEVSPDTEINFGAIPFYGKSLNIEDYDIEAIKSLGFVPKFTFREGLIKLLCWRKE